MVKTQIVTVLYSTETSSPKAIVGKLSNKEVSSGFVVHLWKPLLSLPR